MDKHVSKQLAITDWTLLIQGDSLFFPLIYIKNKCLFALPAH